MTQEVIRLIQQASGLDIALWVAVGFGLFMGTVFVQAWRK